MMALQKDIEYFLANASNEEREILSIMLDSLIQKRESTSSTYISRLMDMTTQIMDDDSIEISVPITPLLANNLGIVHGGLTATLLDTAMGTAANRHLDLHQAAVTSEMKINFTSPGTGSKLTCKAKVLHRGKQMIVTEGKVFGDEGQLIALATGTFFVIRKKENE